MVLRDIRAEQHEIFAILFRTGNSHPGDYEEGILLVLTPCSSEGGLSELHSITAQITVLLIVS
jgi:hypothetical protein